MTKIPLRETRAYVDLDAIAHNLSTLQAKVPDSQLVAAVKADGYGHGALPVAEVCQAYGVAMVAGANLEEAVYLRERGITLPILILEDLFPPEIEPALEIGAILSTGSLGYARQVSKVAASMNRTAQLHVNVDTGMGRMGLLSQDPIAVIREVAQLSNIVIQGIFSHFPSSDEEDKSFSLTQIDRFDQVVAAAREAGIVPRYRHIANSGAILDFPEKLPYELVRPGVTVYGLFPSHEVDRSVPLEPALTLQSRIVKLTRHFQDWTVGYGRTFRPRAGQIIATVPIGYGDGFPRALSNRGSALVHGIRVPIVGRVSMDMVTLDVTDLPEPARLYDEVVLIGAQAWEAPNGQTRREEINAMELADLTDTITYEITCDLTLRIPRVFLRDGRTIGTQTYRFGYQPLEG